MKKIATLLFLALFSFSSTQAEVLNPGKYKVMEEFSTEYTDNMPFLWFGDAYNMEILGELIKNDEQLKEHLYSHFAINLEYSTNLNDVLQQIHAYFSRNLHHENAAKQLMKLMGVVTFKYDDGQIRSVDDDRYIKNFEKYLDSFRDLILANLTSSDDQELAKQRTAELIFEAITGFAAYQQLKNDPTPEEATNIVMKLDYILDYILNNLTPDSGHAISKAELRKTLDQLWAAPPKDEFTVLRSFMPDIKLKIDAEKARIATEKKLAEQQAKLAEQKKAKINITMEEANTILSHFFDRLMPIPATIKSQLDNYLPNINFQAQKPRDGNDMYPWTLLEQAWDHENERFYPERIIIAANMAEAVAIGLDNWEGDLLMSAPVNPVLKKLVERVRVNFHFMEDIQVNDETANTLDQKKQDMLNAKYNVLLESYNPDKKINLIKYIKAETNLGLKDSKAIVDGEKPTLILENASFEDATRINVELEKLGAKTSIEKIR